MTIKPVKVGVIGCGAISRAYFTGAQDYPILEIVACADINPEAAQKAGETYGIAKVYTVDELLADPEIELVLNLTIPQAHAAINRRILEAGKHGYCEKPFALDREEGRAALKLASEKGLRLGCAPDTVLGEGIQTCRDLIDQGAIGDIIGATAFCVGRGHEHWHPNPAFYYHVGGGPLFDMGPYYLTALITLMGEATAVSAMNKTTFPEREILTQPHQGTKVKVETPTHLSGNIRFANGAIATTLFSFDVFGHHHLPIIEIFGTTGTLTVPDPNGFGGKVILRKRDAKDQEEMAHTYTHGGKRSIGLADMAEAIRQNRPHRASGELALHVLDIMQAFHESEREGRQIALSTHCPKPEPLPKGEKPVGQMA